MYSDEEILMYMKMVQLTPKDDNELQEFKNYINDLKSIYLNKLDNIDIPHNVNSYLTSRVLKIEDSSEFEADNTKFTPPNNEEYFVVPQILNKEE